MSRWSFLKAVDGSKELTPHADMAPDRVPETTAEWRVRSYVSEGERITDLKVFGIRTAGSSNGSPQVLRTVIGWIYHNKLTIEDAHADGEQQRLADLNDKAAELRAECDKAKAERDIQTEDVTSLREKLASTRKDLEGVRAGDSSIVEAHGLSDRLSFFISAGILTLLTVYLFLFYVSAIYNAFIFDAAKAAEEGLRTGRELSVTIFNGLAFQKAWSSGAMTFVFLASAPSIVIGLGFLIHHFLKNKKLLAVVAIVSVTFLFDFLLAYEIVYQIHRIRILTGETTAEWSFGLLLSSAEFYIILLAGFVVYIIWGLILQVVLEGIEKFHPARVAIRKLTHAVHEIEEAIGRKEDELKKTTRRIAELDAELKVIEEKRSPRALRNNAFRRHLDEFMQGWFTYLSQAFPDQAESRQSEARQVCDQTVELLAK